MQWLFLTLVALHIATVPTAGMKNQHEYLVCTPQTEFNPGVCDCTASRWRKCFIKLTITKNKFDNPALIDESQLFSVNGGRIGPTIIAKYNQLIVADVYNEINDTENPGNSNISIHWHGMHQFNTAWMDGVGMITEWPTKPRDAFRYVLRAYPSGTHWYHSHMLLQRDEGILGALIVRDRNTKRSRKLFKRVVDNPGKRMLAIRDKVELQAPGLATKLAKTSAICEPDRSMYPLFPLYRNRVVLEPLSINGVKLAHKLPKSIPPNGLKPIFYVKRGKRFRFRILGIMAADVLRISIDKHKLQVVSADGYLTRPFTTDLLVVHIAERYDFILKANNDYVAGTVFPIRIETIAVKCNDYTTPEMVGYAYLQYTDSDDTPEEPILVDHYGDKHRCEVEKCTALNCPFQNYPPEANITCRNVAELRLLNPTPRNQLPQHTGEVVERFLNFAFRGGPVINGIKNELPQNIPFVHSGNEDVVNECSYGSETCPQTCAQTLYLERNSAGKADGTFSPRTIRFVLSSIADFDGSAPNVATHPVHLHGHSFFVTKIGYPPYDESGAIVGMNPNLTQPEADPTCGPAHWTNGERPSDIVVDRRTVRKDVIIVPAGGYVVIEFLADNPGWWFLHCHIDAHSSNGMAIAISELPSCQTTPKNHKFKVKHPYWLSKLRYVRHQLFDNVCNIKRNRRSSIKSIFSDEPEADVQAPEMEKKSDEINMQNLRQETFDPVANEYLDFEHVSPYHKRTDTEQRKFQDQRWDESNM